MRDYGYGHMHDGGGYHSLHWIIPLVLFLLLVGGIAWVIARGAFGRAPHTSSAPAHLPPPYYAPAPPPHAVDPALAAARLRYARGELSREDYARLAADLGAPLPDTGAEPPPPPPAG